MTRQHSWLMVGFVALIATSFALAASLSRVAYEGGSDALSLTFLRTAAAVPALLVILRLRRVSLRLSRRDRLIVLGLGPLNAFFGYAYYQAIVYLPVGIATLVFYTFPLLIALGGWLLGRESLRVPTIVALALAFVGLILALDMGSGTIAPVGVMFAGLAAVACATVFMGLGYAFRGGNAPVRTMYLLASATTAYALACLARGYIALPETGLGWVGFLGSAGTYLFSVIAVYWAIAQIGPLRVSLILNFEPVASIVFGAVLLGQHLAPVQLIGAAFVIGAILLVHRRAPGSPNAGPVGSATVTRSDTRPGA